MDPSVGQWLPPRASFKAIPGLTHTKPSNDKSAALGGEVKELVKKGAIRVADQQLGLPMSAHILTLLALLGCEHVLTWGVRSFGRSGVWSSVTVILVCNFLVIFFVLCNIFFLVIFFLICCFITSVCVRVRV